MLVLTEFFSVKNCVDDFPCFPDILQIFFIYLFISIIRGVCFIHYIFTLFLIDLYASSYVIGLS